MTTRQPGERTPAPSKVTSLGSPPKPEHGFLHRFLRRNLKALDPRQLTLKEYQLTKPERGELVARGLVLTQFAALIGSSIYFLVFQRAWGFQDPPKGNAAPRWNTYWAWKDAYDRAPVHFQNLMLKLGIPMHVFHSQNAPGWYEAARHQGRHFLIGLIAGVLVSSITIGLAKRDYKRVPNWAIPLRFIAGFLVAIPVAAVFIGLFSWFLPHVAQVDIAGWGANIGGAPGAWIGKGAWEGSVIGFVAGFAMKRVIKPAQATVQLISIENHMADGDEPKRWWRLVYGQNYVKRYRYLQKIEHKPERHGKVMGLIMALSVPAAVALVAFAIWNLYLGGPATGVVG